MNVIDGKRNGLVKVVVDVFQQADNKTATLDMLITALGDERLARSAIDRARAKGVVLLRCAKSTWTLMN